MITTSTKKWLILAASQALFAVLTGAFGAHIVKSLVPYTHLSWWNTGCQYLMYHALASLICAWYTSQVPSLRYCILLFFIGSILFAGSLMTMTLTGQTWLGGITPIGGVFYIIGWLYFIWNVIRHK